MKWLVTGLLLFAAFPSTTNYNINSYSFGSGGIGNSTTSNYALEGVSGEFSGQTTSTSNQEVKAGFIETQQAYVPKITVDNGSSTYYNKLHFVIDTQNNPSDALYLISVSTDNFATDKRFVKSDGTLTSTVTLSEYQTYSTWGGASGRNIIGLLPSTTYYVKVKATQGKYTESGYGPVVSAATVAPQLSFSLSTNSISMGNLTSGTVKDAPQPINITYATNGDGGGSVYIAGLHGGLYSASTGATIPSLTGDLTSLSRGFGAQVTAVGMTTGTLSKVAPYSSSSNNVGIIDTALRAIFSSTDAVTGGTGSVLLKAKSDTTDKVAADYTETITFLASASY